MKITLKVNVDINILRLMNFALCTQKVSTIMMDVREIFKQKYSCVVEVYPSLTSTEMATQQRRLKEICFDPRFDPDKLFTIVESLERDAKQARQRQRCGFQLN